jgi:hypothetical protein
VPSAAASPDHASITWLQVAALRLERHHLTERVAPDRLVDVVRELVGVHAQVTSAAELQLAARIDGLRPADVRDALNGERRLIKTWAMRGTLHYLAADDLWRFVDAFPTRDSTGAPAWLKYFKVSRAQLDAVLDAIGVELDGTPRTRAALAEGVGRRLGDAALGERLKSGWGEFLKPAAGGGLLAFGPDEGRHVTFVRPRDWLGSGPNGTIEPLVALGQLTERWLAAFPGAGRDAAARWWGVASRPRMDSAIAAAGAGVVDIDVEGTKGWARSADVARLAAADPPTGVRLLPGFDPFVNELPRRTDALLPVAHHTLVHRTAGWVSPVVLVDGRVAGTWEIGAGAKGKLEVQPFSRLRGGARDELAVEADRIAAFLDRPLAVSIAPPLPRAR